MTTDSALKDSALRTIDIEYRAIEALNERISEDFVKACRLILEIKGRVVVIGMGKSGHIGNKIAATLASTGTPAHFVHPAEASHGDIGMITVDDIVIALSNSGNTKEITSLLPVIKRKGIPLIAITGNHASEIANAADVALDASVDEEACPLGLAPTSSTTAALVLGDALAMSLLEARGFTRDDFALSHPGGSLGRRLLVKVSDVMHSGDAIPTVTTNTTLPDALSEMSAKGFGLTTVNDSDDNFVGVFSDGDLRRVIDAGKNISELCIEDVLSAQYHHVAENELAVEAVKIMEESKVYVLIVKDSQNEIVGIVKMHDLLQANVV